MSNREKTAMRRKVRNAVESFLIFAVGCLLLPIMFALMSCGELVDNSTAVHAAETAGFTDVKVDSKTGIAPQWEGCGKDDAAAFHMSGKNPIGKQVSFLVCCGLWMKGCTVRY